MQCPKCNSGMLAYGCGGMTCWSCGHTGRPEEFQPAVAVEPACVWLEFYRGPADGGVERVGLDHFLQYHQIGSQILILACGHVYGTLEVWDGNRELKLYDLGHESLVR